MMKKLRKQEQLIVWSHKIGKVSFVLYYFLAKLINFFVFVFYLGVVLKVYFKIKDGPFEESNV
jgi:hypothetical protein